MFLELILGSGIFNSPEWTEDLDNILLGIDIFLAQIKRPSTMDA